MSLSVIPGGNGEPHEPDWTKIFSDDADIAVVHDHWCVVVRELKAAGTLAVANGHAIKRLVEFRFQYERAAEQVAEVGPVIKAKRTKVPQYNPYWIVMRQADQSVSMLEAELGLAPTRRGKATKVQSGKKAARPADEFLKPLPQ